MIGLPTLCDERALWCAAHQAVWCVVHRAWLCLRDLFRTAIVAAAVVMVFVHTHTHTHTSPRVRFIVRVYI